MIFVCVCIFSIEMYYNDTIVMNRYYALVIVRFFISYLRLNLGVVGFVWLTSRCHIMVYTRVSYLVYIRMFLFLFFCIKV